jgi:CubicO group peptidase (beta-lactamase class C family)
MPVSCTRLSFLFALSVAFLASFGSQILYGQETPETARRLAERIQRVETELPPVPLGHDQPPLQLDLHALMELYKVSGLSVAVIDDFKVVWAKGYGFADPSGKTPVTTRTLFQAASISKPVTAMAALHLVEHGKLTLDEDVNRKLVNWKVPESEFTKDQKVTLRRLLSHSAGANIEGGFKGYDVDDPIPTLTQVLNGTKPASSEAVRIDFVPGTKWRYSGGGYTIVQQLMIDVTGKAFPQLMHELVLDKIKMADSTFEEPLPSTRAAMAATGIFANGEIIHGKARVFPEMAAAGLWTTPSDLAKFAIEIALSTHGKSNRILSQAMARQMLTPQIDIDAAIPWTEGLGFFIDKKNSSLFAHNGWAWAFQGIVVMLANNGKGVAIMTNSNNGFALSDRLISSVAQEYGWKCDSLDPNGRYLLFFIARARGGKAAIQKYRDLKASPSAPFLLDEGTLDQVGHDLLDSGKTQDAVEVLRANVEEYPQSADLYASLGEAYMRSDQKELAIQNYEKCLTLDPKNENAIEALRKLRPHK